MTLTKHWIRLRGERINGVIHVHEDPDRGGEGLRLHVFPSSGYAN